MYLTGFLQSIFYNTQFLYYETQSDQNLFLSHEAPIVTIGSQSDFWIPKRDEGLINNQ